MSLVFLYLNLGIMLQKHLQGLIAAPFTPMHPDGSLNLAVVPSYYAMLRNNGVAGAFICGSTGEGVSLTITEKMAVAEAWASCTKNDSAFTTIPLLGGSCIADAQALAIHAEAIGLDAVAFTSPCYFKPANVEMLAACCSEVASVVPNMPFYYYHIPVLTGVGFAMYDLLKAIDGIIPNFAGVKYTHEDFMDFLSCLHFKNRQYDMVWGRDENMLPALAIGAKASIGSTYNYAAPLYHALIEAFNKADLQKAQMLQQKSIDMIRLLGKYGGIATGKAYMKMIDLDCGTFRLPVTNMDSANFELFKNEVASIGFADFCSK
jgi:N-acetylneuraminate lyase